MTPSENRPHLVKPKDRILGEVLLFPTYRDAWDHWCTVHRWDNPYSIVTLGRECSPAAPVVDVNE